MKLFSRYIVQHIGIRHAGRFEASYLFHLSLRFKTEGCHTQMNLDLSGLNIVYQCADTMLFHFLSHLEISSVEEATRYNVTEAEGLEDTVRLDCVGSRLGQSNIVMLLEQGSSPARPKIPVK